MKNNTSKDIVACTHPAIQALLPRRTLEALSSDSSDPFKDEDEYLSSMEALFCMSASLPSSPPSSPPICATPALLYIEYNYVVCHALLFSSAPLLLSFPPHLPSPPLLPSSSSLPFSPSYYISQHFVRIFWTCNAHCKR